MSTASAPLHRPVGYPSEFERRLEIRDRGDILIRPVVPDDSAVLLRELERADEETIYNRFFRAPVRLDAAQLGRLTTLDYDSRFALAALAKDGDGVAVARYETTAPGVAEIAVVVRSEWRRCGLGSELLADLERAAVGRGIRHFSAYYLSDNVAIESLLAGRGFEVGIRDGEVSMAEKDIVPQG
jgi:acetyltransferase